MRTDGLTFENTTSLTFPYFLSNTFTIAIPSAMLPNCLHVLTCAVLSISYLDLF